MLWITAAWGACFVAIEWGLRDAPLLWFAALRALVAGAALLAVGAAWHRPAPSGGRAWGLITVLGLVNVTVAFAAMFAGVAGGATGTAAVLANAQPLLILLPAWWIYREKLSPRTAAALVVGFAGLVLVALPGGGGSGAALSLLAAAAVTAGTLLSRRLAGLDLVTATAWHLLIGGAGLTVLAAAVEGAPVIAWTPRFTVSLAFLALVGTAATTVAWFAEARRSRLDTLTTWTFLTPVFGITLAAVALGERPGGWTAVGLLAVLAAMWITLRPPRRTPTPSAAVAGPPDRGPVGHLARGVGRGRGAATQPELADRRRTVTHPTTHPTPSTVAPAPTGAVPPQEAVIFDLEGVVTDTATLHAEAWRQLFEMVFADPQVGGPGTHAPFDAVADYRRHVDGRSREDGVAAFLTARGIDVPVGTPQDPAGAWTVHGLAARTNEIYLDLLAARGTRAFPGTVDLLARLRAGGVPVALVTASRNADALLAAGGLAGVFDVVVDGDRAAELGLAGKPDPAMFLTAASELGVAPARVAVVEDAVAGVQAARSGGFGLVVGVARAGQRGELEAAGAHLVVEDVAQLDLGALRADPWTLVYEGFDPAHEGHREALTTLGNGYLGTRGAAPERAADGVHYPGSYLAGVYNRLVSTVHGRQMEDEHLVNAPNWLVLDLGTEEAGSWWSAGGFTASQERRELDLRRGVLTRTAVLTDPAGRRLHLRQRRLVSMTQPHLAALETTVVPDGWSGTVRVRSGIDAGVVNANVAEYASLANRHLRTTGAGQAGPGILLVEVETVQSQVRIAVATRTTVNGSVPEAVLARDDELYSSVLELPVRDGEPVTIDKIAAVYTSKDAAIASPRLAVLGELTAAPLCFDGLLGPHVAAWERLWDRFGIELKADTQTRLVLNLHVFHLLQTLSTHTAELDAGVPARGLHGEGYRGHVFWDELFVLPVLMAHLPQVSRGLLDYRWRRLDTARRAAAQAGLPGAMFPWQSGSDGREETPVMLFNTRSGRWMPDNSSRQRHVGLAIAYNAWEYYQATGDLTWLTRRGADLIIEVARFFTALATHDPSTDRFHISGVMGPDEYHDGYPDAPGEGLVDNAYTNVLTAWVCQRALDVLQTVAGHEGDDLHARLDIAPEEPATWEHLSRRLAVPFLPDGLIAQFSGYEHLAELDWDRYRRTYGNIGRLDLILEAEGDATNRYKLAKQADVLMLIYLLGPDGLVSMLNRLGYPTTRQVLARTVDYYLARTAHGSTLSRVVHASVLARLDPAHGWATFREALTADLDDTQGGTTQEGIHLGAMAGTIDILTRSFTGYRTEGTTVALDPALPAGLHALRFRVQHRGQRLLITLDETTLTVTAEPCAANPRVRLRVADHAAALIAGTPRRFRREADVWRPEEAGQPEQSAVHRLDAGA